MGLFDIFKSQTPPSEDRLQLLKDYDTIIIVDDSGSMHGFWKQTRKALRILVDIASRYDTDGIDIYFLNSPVSKTGVKSAEEVGTLFDQVLPEGRTPLGRRLGEITAKRPVSSKKINYLIITDGCPDNRQDVKTVIIDTVAKLNKAVATLTQIGFQFIQVGRDSGATDYLRELDTDLGVDRDIVDTKQFPDGEITKDEVVNILLGGINRKVDRQDEITPPRR